MLAQQVQMGTENTDKSSNTLQSQQNSQSRENLTQLNTLLPSS